MAILLQITNNEIKFDEIRIKIDSNHDERRHTVRIFRFQFLCIDRIGKHETYYTGPCTGTEILNTRAELLL